MEHLHYWRKCYWTAFFKESSIHTHTPVADWTGLDHVLCVALPPSPYFSPPQILRSSFCHSSFPQLKALKTHPFLSACLHSLLTHHTFTSLPVCCYLLFQTSAQPSFLSKPPTQTSWTQAFPPVTYPYLPIISFYGHFV